MLMRSLLGAGLALALSTSALAEAGEATNPPGGAAILTWTFDQQLYGYRNMEKLQSHHVAPRGTTVRELPGAGRTIDPHWTHDGQHYDLASYMDATRTSGLLVLKEGKVVFERYALGRTQQDRWTSFSVAKSVTAILLGAAIQDGYIKSMEDPVTAYLPQLKGSAYEGVSIRQLVTMTTGVRWVEDYTDPQSDVAKVGLSIEEPGVNPVVSYMRRLPRATPAGTKFVYNTGETDLAGVLISTAVGRPMAQYLSEKLWIPYGMDTDAIWIDDIAGHERGGCCLSVTLRDYARIGQFLLEGGVVQGKAVLPPGWVADATRAQTSFPPGPGGETGYGYFFWIRPDGYSAEGIFGQQIFVYPAEQIVIAVNAAWPVATRPDLWAGRAEMAKAVRESLK